MPLSQSDINQLVSDTLSCDSNQIEPLVELVYQETQGNPFFTTQFLKALHQDGLIQFNQQLGSWKYDISQIKLENLTDDVVEFMARQLQKLPPDTQEVLKLAACMGAEFDLATLAIISQQSELATGAALWKSLQLGLVIPLEETYKFFQADEEKLSSQILLDKQTVGITYRFLHDRVQQAAYSLIPEIKRSPLHYQIGKLLLQQLSPAEKEERLFTIVNQLNYGIKLITDQGEKDELAQLNLEAGHKAKLSVAYQAAYEYAETGLSLLGEISWQNQYEISLFCTIWLQN